MGTTTCGDLRETRSLYPQQHHRAPWIGQVRAGRIEEDFFSHIKKVLTAGKARIDDAEPAPSLLLRGDCHTLQMRVGIQDDEKMVDAEFRFHFTAIEPIAQGSTLGVLPVWTAEICAEPGDIGHRVIVKVLTLKELSMLE